MEVAGAKDAGTLAISTRPFESVHLFRFALGVIPAYLRRVEVASEREEYPARTHH